MNSFQVIDPDIKSLSTFTQRKLSYIEYCHACVGHAKNSLERPRENTLILEGDGMIEPAALARAVSEAAAANPAATLKLVGKRSRAAWVRAGSEPAIRVVDGSRWDGLSEQGSEFIYEKKLSLEDGITGEFILVKGAKNFLIFRNLHAIMDGIGTMHFLADVFNALNVRTLVRTNTDLGDTGLMKSVKSVRHKVDTSKRIARPTGARLGTDKGDSWYRFSLQGPQLFLLPRIAAAIADFTRNYSNDTVLISVPVNMRRHKPGMRSTMNYTCIAYIEVDKNDDASTFHKKLHAQLKNNSEAFYMPTFELVRYLPFSWVDALTTRTKNNYLDKKIFETAMISDMGLFNADAYSGAGFTAKGLFGIPIPSNTYCLICTLGNTINITLGMPKIYASEGRLEKLMHYIEDRLTA